MWNDHRRGAVRPSVAVATCQVAVEGAASVSWGLIVALSLVLAVPVLAEPAQSPPGELFISWHAPPGYPGASDTLVTACDDSTRIDTLFVGFSLSRALPQVQAVSAVLYFHPLDGDTLGPFWFFKRGWPNQGNMLIELHPSHGFVCPTPWAKDGAGSVAYDHRSGRGRLDLIYGVNEADAKAVGRDQPLCFAMVLIHHRRLELAGCSQPVCVEFASAKIRYQDDREIEVTGGELSFLPWNAGGREEARSRIRHSVVKPWQPKSDQRGGR